MSYGKEDEQVNYVVAYRMLEQACRILDRINTPLSRDIYLKLKEPKRELEDIIW